MIKFLRNELDSKKIGAVELLEEYRKKIEEKSYLNCFITNDWELAKKQAKSAQEVIDKKESCILTGIPVAVKDNICTKGVKTTCASRMLEDFIPDFSATAVKNLENSGYILSGKTNMDEFGMGNISENSIFGAVKNPLDNKIVAGGSSGGSACAVSSGLSPAALGSDTGGSIRQPAAFCGCFGLKPTYGKVSRHGLIAFASSLEQIGITATTAEDILIVLNAISGKDTHDATSVFSKECELKNIKGKIGLPKEFFDYANPKIQNAVENAAKKFEDLGFSVEYCSISSLKYAVSAYYIISSAEAASNLSRFDGVKYGFKADGKNFEEIVALSRSYGFGTEVKRRIMLGNYVLSEGFYDKYYIKAQGVQRKLKSEFSELFNTYDFLITPTVPDFPKKLCEKLTPSESYKSDILTVPQNLAGLPSLAVPCGKVDNLCVSFSITGKAFSESEIISLAHLYERKCIK